MKTSGSLPCTDYKGKSYGRDCLIGPNSGKGALNAELKKLVKTFVVLLQKD